MEGLGSRAWKTAWLLGSAPGLRLPLQAGAPHSCHSSPAWLMQPSGKFDFSAEKARRRGAQGRKGPAGAAPGLACLRFVEWP